MCGICGIFEFEPGREIPHALVHRMAETMIHRGPDDEGIFTGPGIGLGFRRLSIIDVKGGHQPIPNEDRRIWVMLNGEIYNYPELRRDLIARGHRFATGSDTETIVHLYEELGEKCFSRLRGMFAIALWDSIKRKLVLARDRVGKKPLFYAENGKRIVFGSELKSLLASDCLSRDIDLCALSDYFSYGYIPAPKTIYRAAGKLLPGHFLVASAAGVRVEPYWDLSFGHVENHSEEEWCERIRHELCEATRIRLMSEVPLGAFLSGGIDSSAVVATMARIMKKPVITCSIGFAEERYNEADYARGVARQFATSHHEHVVRPNALEVLDQLVWHYDEPFADSSAVPTYYVSQIARQHVTVALGGDGGDENFAGYPRYLADCRENRLRRSFPASVRHGIFGPLGRVYPALGWAPRYLRAKVTLQNLASSPLEGYFNSISIFRPADKSNLFAPGVRQALRDYDASEVLRRHYERADTDDPLSRIQYADIKTYLADDILAKVDRASMAVSLEVRAPLLDHKLMETVAAIPSSLKVANGEGKYIFKKAMAPVLTPQILYRRKQGFSIPIDRWLRQDLREGAHDALFGIEDGILNPSFLKTIWEQHQSGRCDRSAELWAVLMFRKWQAAFGV
ncbi:MAG TPA: XrtA/PEP-CTERM system amidotransferase [Candidatus Dormibacteraeota bacterium]|nr:XrtA/PEP-CTERM system amidotransferase [Candidatus Dormibacteraeota bacterium]